MSGLRRVCRALGGMVVTGNDGTTIRYVWDYVADVPVTEQEMPFGSERHLASERVRYAPIATSAAPVSISERSASSPNPEAAAMKAAAPVKEQP